jgi:hypothetical protein
VVRLAALVAVFAVVVAQPAGTAPRPPVRLSGSADLAAVQLASCIRVDDGNAKVVECPSSRGSYRGTPARARASYSWHWHLFHGGEAPQTAHGDEDGLLVLDFGARGVLRVKTAGSKAAGITTGAWRFWRGTKQFAARRGTGTYRFETVASGETGLRSLRVVVRGTLR